MAKVNLTWKKKIKACRTCKAINRHKKTVRTQHTIYSDGLTICNVCGAAKIK